MIFILLLSQLIRADVKDPHDLYMLRIHPFLATANSTCKDILNPKYNISLNAQNKLKKDFNKIYESFQKVLTSFSQYHESAPSTARLMRETGGRSQFRKETEGTSPFSKDTDGQSPFKKETYGKNISEDDSPEPLLLTKSRSEFSKVEETDPWHKQLFRKEPPPFKKVIGFEHADEFSTPKKVSPYKNNQFVTNEGGMKTSNEGPDLKLPIEMFSLKFQHDLFEIDTSCLLIVLNSSGSRFREILQYYTTEEIEMNFFIENGAGMFSKDYDSLKMVNTILLLSPLFMESAANESRVKINPHESDDDLSISFPEYSIGNDYFYQVFSFFTKLKLLDLKTMTGNNIFVQMVYSLSRIEYIYKIAMIHNCHPSTIEGKLEDQSHYIRRHMYFEMNALVAVISSGDIDQFEWIPLWYLSTFLQLTSYGDLQGSTYDEFLKFRNLSLTPINLVEDPYLVGTSETEQFWPLSFLGVFIGTRPHGSVKFWEYIDQVFQNKNIKEAETFLSVAFKHFYSMPYMNIGESTRLLSQKAHELLIAEESKEVSHRSSSMESIPTFKKTQYETVDMAISTKNRRLSRSQCNLYFSNVETDEYIEHFDKYTFEPVDIDGEMILEDNFNEMSEDNMLYNISITQHLDFIRLMNAARTVAFREGHEMYMLLPRHILKRRLVKDEDVYPTSLPEWVNTAFSSLAKLGPIMTDLTRQYDNRKNHETGLLNVQVPDKIIEENWPTVKLVTMTTLNSLALSGNYGDQDVLNLWTLLKTEELSQLPITPHKSARLFNFNEFDLYYQILSIFLKEGGSYKLTTDALDRCIFAISSFKRNIVGEDRQYFYFYIDRFSTLIAEQIITFENRENVLKNLNLEVENVKGKIAKVSVRKVDVRRIEILKKMDKILKLTGFFKNKRNTGSEGLVVQVRKILEELLS